MEMNLSLISAGFRWQQRILTDFCNRIPVECFRRTFGIWCSAMARDNRNVAMFSFFLTFGAGYMNHRIMELLVSINHIAEK